MDIAFLAPANCIRVSKEAEALKNLYSDIRIHLITGRLFNDNLWDSIHYYTNPYQLKNIIKNIKNIDIFHVHNEPSWPANIVRDEKPDSKIVMDMHDSYYWRVTKRESADLNEEIRWYEEDVANSVCDAFIVVSPKCAEELSNRVDRKIVVIPSACPIKMYVYKQHAFRGGLVSQGGIVHPDNAGVIDHWRDFTELFKIISQDKQIWIYSAAIKYDKDSALERHYADIGCKMGSFNAQSVIDTLGCHTWNLVGNYHSNKNARVWEYAWPNKMFDALAAGVPSICIGAAEAAKFIDKYKIGIVCDTPKEIIERWDEHQEYRENVMRVRESLSMENFIPKLRDLYEEVLNG